MPVPANAYVLLQPDLKKQFVYNSGKLSWKIGKEKQTMVEALSDLGLNDIATLYKYMNLYKTSPELEEAVGPVALEILKTNIAHEYDELFVAGISAAKELEKIKKTLSKIEQVIPEEVKTIKEATNQLKKPSTLSCTIRLRGPKNTTSVTKNIVNRPDNWWSLDKFRGGAQFEPDNEKFLNLTRPAIGINLSQSDINDKNWQQFTKKIGKALSKNHITLFIIVAGILFIFFKKRRFLRSFLRSIKSCMNCKPIRKIYSIYKHIKACKLINNRVVRGLYIFNRAINRI